MRSFREYDEAFKDAFMDSYKEADTSRKMFNIVPAGTYTVRINSVELTDRNNIRAAAAKNKKAEDTYANSLEVTCTIEDGGQYDGIVCDIKIGVCIGNVRLLKQTLNALGYELHGLDKLEDDINSRWADGKKCIATVTKRGAYSNMWLQVLVDEAQESGEEEAPWTPQE